MLTIPSHRSRFVVQTILLTTCLAALSLVLLPGITVRADPVGISCPFPPKDDQCLCHNVPRHDGGGGPGQEICPNESGIESGHDAHVDCWNEEGVGCSVEDQCGKCNGCGNGVLEDGEECDDFNNVPGDGCDADCLFEYQADQGDGVDDADEVPDGDCLYSPSAGDDSQSSASNGDSGDLPSIDELREGIQFRGGAANAGGGCESSHDQVEVNSNFGEALPMPSLLTGGLLIAILVRRRKQ